jgi:chaperonin cofactor prefoldin
MDNTLKGVPVVTEEFYVSKVKDLLSEIRVLEDNKRELEKEIQELKHFRFETKNYHGQLRKDFSWGWFEHIEYGEDGGTGNFDIELTDTTWEIVDCDGCYDVPEEVQKEVGDLIDKASPDSIRSLVQQRNY